MKKILLFRKEITLLSLSAFLTFAFTSLTFAQTFTANNQGAYQSGTHDGFFYSFWSEGGGQATMTLGPQGNYSTTWTNIQNFTAGKGWRTGSRDRVICFEGSYNGGSNGFLAVYGWTRNPLIEYYVVESHGQWRPPGNTSDIESMGTVYSDGDTYDIYRSLRENKPSIDGNATFYQFWSVRRNKRTSGTVTFANHVDAWEKTGLTLGSSWDYQIMESEGYGSTGSSNITVKECVTCATAAPTATISYDYEVGDIASPLSASGNSLKWYIGSATATAQSQAPTPSTASVGTTKYYVSQTQNGCEGPKVEITVRVSQTYKIFKVPVPITIDGTIDASWKDVNVESMNAGITLVGSNISPNDLSAYAKMLWDDTYLYVLADVTDDNLQNDSQNNYDDDAVEIYIDINNDKSSSYGSNDFQYTFRWNDGTAVGVRPESGSTTGITYSAVETSGGYMIEARIPWSTLGGSPADGQMIGVDFMINDDDDGSGRDGKKSWNSATDEAYQDASLFGTGKLVNQEVITGTRNNILESVSVFPNPSSSEIFVTGLTGNFEYAIFDYAGRQVLTGESAEKVDLKTLEKGSYLLKVKQGEHIKVVKVSKL